MSQSTGVSSPYKRILKLAVVGAGGVGKSTLIARLTTGAFTKEWSVHQGI